MKHITYLTLFSLVITLIACGDNKQQNAMDHVDHQNMDHSNMEHSAMTQEDHTVQKSTHMSAMISAYLDVKDALIKDDVASASKAGEQLALAASSIDNAELKPVLDKVQEMGSTIAKESLAGQRAQLEMMYAPMTTLIEALGTSQTLYQQYCPMYNGNQGGSWLSAVETIENPYFGDKMLRCGSVKQTFAVN
jgi:hypothetical protein